MNPQMLVIYPAVGFAAGVVFATIAAHKMGRGVTKLLLKNGGVLGLEVCTSALVLVTTALVAMGRMRAVDAWDLLVQPLAVYACYILVECALEVRAMLSRPRKQRTVEVQKSKEGEAAAVAKPSQEL